MKHWLTIAGAAALLLTPTSLPAQDNAIAIIEVSEEMLVDLGPIGFDLRDKAIARAFYALHPDRFDHIIIMTDFKTALAGGRASGLYFPVSSDVTGLNIGLDGALSEVFDFTDEYGSDGRLKGTILLGDARDLPADPRAPDFAEGRSSLGVLGQETLHQFGAFVHYRSEGQLFTDLLGRGGAHWSFFFHTDGSDLEGNRWLEDPETGDFVSGAVGGRFNQLDQYLMGLRAPDQITESWFVITDPEPILPENATARTGPLRDAVVRGGRREVTVDMVVDAHGPRVPTARQSPKVLNQAFVLLTDPASDPEERQDAYERLARLRSQWGRYYYEAADARGRVVTTLDGRDSTPRWRFITSIEGWQVEGAEIAVGMDTGALVLTPTATTVALFHDALDVDGAAVRHWEIEATVSGGSGCALEASISAGGAALPFALATDGTTHRATVESRGSEGFDGPIEGLRLEFEVPESDLGRAQVILTDLDGVSAPAFPDRDRDGVLDSLDNCADVANPVQFDADGDGIGDACVEGGSVCSTVVPDLKPVPPDCMCAVRQGPVQWPWWAVLGLLSLAASRGSRARWRGGSTSAPGQRADH